MFLIIYLDYLSLKMFVNMLTLLVCLFWLKYTAINLAIESILFK